MNNNGTTTKSTRKPAPPYKETAKQKQRDLMTGNKHTEDTKSRMSEAHKGHDVMPKSVMTPLGEFESLTAAARAHNITPAAVYFRLRRPTADWYYTNNNVLQTAAQKNRCTLIQVPDGRHFGSILDASKDLNLSIGYIQHALKMSDVVYKDGTVHYTGWKRL